jgi:CRP-like cAMP-binding protein
MMHDACVLLLLRLQDERAANVKALTDGSLLALHRDDFDALLGSLSHIRHMWRFEALRKVRCRGRTPCGLNQPM